MELKQIDPKTLAVKANVRITSGEADQAFLDSIKTEGIMEPITVYVETAQDDTQKHVVLYGHRRTAAAVALRLAEVPVIVVGKPTEADRLARQVAENQRRAGLTEAETAQAAFEAMEHLNASQVAKRFHIKAEQVKQIKATFTSEAATTFLQDGLPLETAAAVAEFSDDAEALEALNESIARGTEPQHAVARIRQEREDAAMIAEEAARLEAEGKAVITDPSQVNSEHSYYEKPDPELAMRVRQLYTKDNAHPTEEDANAYFIHVTTEWNNEARGNVRVVRVEAVITAGSRQATATPRPPRPPPRT